jgi:hypothetical protein
MVIALRYGDTELCPGRWANRVKIPHGCVLFHVSGLHEVVLKCFPQDEKKWLIIGIQIIVLRPEFLMLWKKRMTFLVLFPIKRSAFSEDQSVIRPRYPLDSFRHCR